MFRIGSNRLLQAKSSRFLSTLKDGQGKKSNKSSQEKEKEIVTTARETRTALQLLEVRDETGEEPRKHVFQNLTKIQSSEPIYTIQQAALPDEDESVRYSYKYPKLSYQSAGRDYFLRSVDNEFSKIVHFPDRTDYLCIGAGLVGSAAAYYTKRRVSRVGDVLVMDKNPYSPLSNCTAICNGLLSSQSKSKDIARVTTLSKELIRNLQYDIMCTKEDFAQIKYRPCTHLILWPKEEVEEVLDAVSSQIEDGLYIESRLPHELESTFPFLKATDSDIALGTHGNQDEALIDPIGLRNLYRTLAQAYGANFVIAEAIDFNSFSSITQPANSPSSAAGIVCRLPKTGELRSLFFGKTLLCLGHETPFLEARSEMETYMRDQVQDLHFLQPNLRLCFAFHSISAPVINFPVITDTDGSILIKEDYAGNFKYYLTYDECENFLEEDINRFMDVDSEEPYPNLIHRGEMFRDYFENVIKPKLVNRVPLMADATFDLAYSGFENHNSFDGNPVLGPHPYHSTVVLAGGYGSRMMNYAAASGAILSELMTAEEEELFDVTQFYWNRVIKNRPIKEFSSLIR